MWSCPGCNTPYSDGVEVCPRDGHRRVLGGDLTAPPAEIGVAATLPELDRVPSAAPAGESSPGSTRPDPSSGFGAASAAAAAVPVAELQDPAPGSGEVFDSLVGATLAGRYRIIRRIGEGGMGAVYEARHTIIGKRVAVKVLLEKFLTKSDFVARLLQEARLASAIGHEHIVDVTDFGTTDDGRAFVAMEFLDGESLAQLVMREAPLPVERSLRIARQVASALGAAHAKGIVHRDVKPENVYLIRRGDADFVKVVDFGISKAVKQGQGDDAPDYRLTHTGLLLGTPLYMSPEQARGDDDLDPRVDVWAMGVMLYECLTGEVPFRANNYLGIISQVLTHTAVPPSKLRPELGIPEAVEAVVMHAMEKDRNRRYPLMSDVERDLDRLLAGDQNVGAGATSLSATAPPPMRAARGRAWVWGAAVAALVGGVAMVLARPESPSDKPNAGAPPTSVQKIGPVPTQQGPAVVAGAPGSTGVADHVAGRARSGDSQSVDASHGADPSVPRRLVRVSNRPGREKFDRAARVGGASSLPRGAEKGTSKTADAVIRGALPSRSGEGYPDN